MVAICSLLCRVASRCQAFSSSALIPARVRTKEKFITVKIAKPFPVPRPATQLAVGPSRRYSALLVLRLISVRVCIA